MWIKAGHQEIVQKKGLISLKFFFIPNPPGRETDFGKHGGHGFVTKFTAVGLFGDHWYTKAFDFINPMADINDALDLMDELSNEDGNDSELDENDSLDIEN